MYAYTEYRDSFTGFSALDSLVSAHCLYHFYLPPANISLPSSLSTKALLSVSAFSDIDSWQLGEGSLHGAALARGPARARLSSSRWRYPVRCLLVWGTLATRGS